MELHEAEKLIDDCLKCGRELLASNRPEMAEMVLQQVIRCSKDHPEALHLMGLVRHQQGKYAEGLDYLDHVLAIEPNNADAHSNRALCQTCLGNIRGSIASLEKALEIRQDSHIFWNNLGLQLRQLGKIDESFRAFRRSIKIKRDPETFSNLGGLYGEMKRCKSAIACFRQALRLEPENKHGREGLAYARLLSGDMEKGWEEFESRIDIFPQLLFYRMRYDQEKRWRRGDDLKGKKIALYAEQGAGDAINFVRFIRRVKSSFDCHVALHCSPSLESLFRDSDLGIDEFHTANIVLDTRVPEHDFHACLMSLPHLLGFGQPPIQPPYLRSSLEATLPDDDKKRIGICWAGSPSHPNDSRRSIPLRDFEPIYRMPDVSLYSLQQETAPRAYRYQSRPVDLAEGCGDWVMTDCRPWMSDWASTAAIVDKLDAVVTSDTAILHLAGAMGKPTFALIPYNPDWRWGLDGERTPWYPHVRLIRQQRPGDWSGAIEHVVGVLKA